MSLSLSLSFLNCTVIIHAYLIRNMLYFWHIVFRIVVALPFDVMGTQVTQFVAGNIISIRELW